MINQKTLLGFLQAYKNAITREKIALPSSAMVCEHLSIPWYSLSICFVIG